MLSLTGVIRGTAVLGGGTNRKTGEVIPERSVVQLETLDGRGLVQMHTLTVPDLTKFQGKTGQEVSLPVRAWAPGAQVNLMYEERA